MIARCDWCDAKSAASGSLTRVGYRYNPVSASLRGHHCGYCSGALRPKRKGETETVIVDAGWGPAKRVRRVPA